MTLVSDEATYDVCDVFYYSIIMKSYHFIIIYLVQQIETLARPISTKWCANSFQEWIEHMCQNHSIKMLRMAQTRNQIGNQRTAIVFWLMLTDGKRPEEQTARYWMSPTSSFLVFSHLFSCPQQLSHLGTQYARDRYTNIAGTRLRPCSPALLTRISRSVEDSTVTIATADYLIPPSSYPYRTM